MSRRIDVELTSNRGDGTWTWRASGAREPKGLLDHNVLPPSAKVGDNLKVEADFDMDGITILSVVPAKGARKAAEMLSLIPSNKPFEEVTQKLASKGDRPRRDGDDRPRRDGDRPRRDAGRPGGDREPRSSEPRSIGDAARPASDRPRGDRPDGRPRGERSPGGRPGGDRPGSDRPAGSRPPRQFTPRPAVPELPVKPKPKRLKPGRAHRSAYVASLPEEQRPIADQVLRSGIPGVRQALIEQNELLKTEGKPEIKPQGVLSLAEDLLPKLRVAEWLDRAEAAKAGVAELDLRDLRSVVVAAEDPAVSRDESTRALAGELKAALASRQDSEHTEWLADIVAALDIGRSVRALRLSSRPPKAGVRFPAELAVKLSGAAAESLTPENSSDRWVAVIEALAFSPVRNQVVAAAPPATPSAELLSTVKRFAKELPAIAAVFGIDPPTRGERRPKRVAAPPPPASAPSAVVAEVVTTPEPVAEVVETAAVEPVAEIVETAAVEPAAEAGRDNADALSALGFNV